MNRLFEIIKRETQKHGVIPFARFMELALYCPVYGYYEKERDTVGRHGDFFTSVSVGSLFGELLAFQFAEWLHEVRSVKCEVRIVECGAHDGQLAEDILGWMRQRRPELFAALEYCIVEPSERRRARQQETLREFTNTVRWVGQLLEFEGNPSSAIRHPPSAGVCGVVFSNELLDAMPAHRLGWDAIRKEWFEWGVTLQNGEFVWAKMESPRSTVQGPRSEVRITDHASRVAPPELPEALLEVLPDGFTAEICPGAVSWWSEAARMLRRGKLLTIDYGLGAEDLFAPERKEGTLRAYSRHHLSKHLLANPGEQDITAHVNFAAIQAAGEAAGLKTEQFVTQAALLTRIMERVWKEQPDSGQWTPARSGQFQTLTHPDHLGRRFRVLVQSRTGEEPPMKSAG